MSDLAVPGPRIELRPATSGDARRIWEWRNDPDTRRASFDEEPIPWDVHQVWMEETLRRPDRKLYLVVADGVESGVVRLDLGGGEAKVSINLAPAARYQGVGAAALDALARLAFSALGVERLTGEIKRDNAASLAAFVKAGFALVEGPESMTAVRSREGG